MCLSIKVHSYSCIAVCHRPCEAHLHISLSAFQSSIWCDVEVTMAATAECKLEWAVHNTKKLFWFFFLSTDIILLLFLCMAWWPVKCKRNQFNQWCISFEKIKKKKHPVSCWEIKHWCWNGLNWFLPSTETHSGGGRQGEGRGQWSQM